MAVARTIAAEPRLQRLYDTVARRSAGDPGHDMSHLWRVAVWTLRLGGRRVIRREAIAAAFLHDFVNAPKSSPRRAQASAQSAEAARSLLGQAGFDADALARIGAAIRDHSFSRGARPSEPLAAALQDADRLDALGAIGVLRAAAVGAAMGSQLLDAGDPWARARPLDDRRFVLDHFFTKLFRLPELMLTAAGRAEARRRCARMRRFLIQIGVEAGEPWRPGPPGPSRRPSRGTDS